MDNPAWDHSTCSFNRERLFDAEIAQAFSKHTVLLAEVQGLVSDEHFTVDGSLLEPWASQRSFRPKDGGDDESDGGDFRYQRRINDTLASGTAPDARLARQGKGKEAKLSYLVNALMENRNDLIVGVDVRHACGRGERDGALVLIDAHGLRPGRTVGADKGYDTRECVAEFKARQIKGHIARHTRGGRRSRVDRRTAAGKHYAIRQQVRKRIEQGFGWAKTVGPLRKLPLKTLPKFHAWVRWTFAAYNLISLGAIGQWWAPAPT